MKKLVGIDEAGRGALAGPMLLSACVFKEKLIKGLNDSKKLSPKKRLILEKEIKKNCEYLIIHFDNKNIDDFGLSSCLKKGLSLIKRHFKGADFIYDGNCAYKTQGIKCLVKADLQIAEVMAASILAKCARDRYMQALISPFSFKNHKGYGTKKHIEELAKFKRGKYHRKSFVLKQQKIFSKPCAGF